jgi:hypothetical protein
MTEPGPAEPGGACAVFHKQWAVLRAARGGQSGEVAPGPGSAGVVGGLLLTGAALVAAALADGSAGVLGVCVGLGLTLVVFGFGMGLTAAVARLTPALSLLVALLTYALQLLVLLMVLTALERSDLLGGSLDREWLGGSVIAATVVWTTALALYHSRSVARDSADLQDVPDRSDGPTSG